MAKKTNANKKQKIKNLKQSEKEALRISEQKLSTIADEWRTTFDAIKDAISLTDVEGKIIRCNKAMSNLLGKSFQEIIGHTCWDLMHDTPETIKGCPITRMKETLKKETMILPIDERVFEVIADPIFDDSGGLSGAVHIISDITGRKRAEEKIQESEKLYRLLSENTYDMITRHLPDSTYLYVSPACRTLFGYEPEELIGTKAFDQMHPEDVESVIAITRQAIRTGNPEMGQYRHLKKDGQYIWVETMGRVIKNKITGEIEDIICVVRDINDRKQAEETLIETEEKYKTLTENSLTGIFIHQDGRYLFINNKFAEIHGYKPEELLGKEHLILTHPDERDTLRELVLKRLEGESVPQRYEVRRIRKDGKTIWCEMMAARIQYKGRPAIMGNIIDITERKKTEEVLKKSYEEILLRQESMLNLSEDLFKEVDERKAAEKKIREYSNQLRRLASQISLAKEQEHRRIANILHDSIGQNLALTKIKLEELKELASSEHLSIHFDELRKTISQAINFVRSLTFEISPPVLYELGFEAAIEWLGEQILKQHKIMFTFEDDRQPKPLSETTKVLLFQAVKEFLINIIKHSKAHNVRVSSQKDGSNIRISIEDDGIGFDLTGISTKIMETGSFGLFSIRERLTTIAGTYEIDSVPGKGTQIRLIAPLENT